MLINILIDSNLNQTIKNYHRFNFFKNTYCEFKKVEVDFFREHQIHYKSKSGSLYFYTEKGVYRYSNHWGRVANCRWKISGIEAYKNQIYYVGYANWLDFYPLNASEKIFYLEFIPELEAVKIIKVNEEKDETQFLMTLEFALLRLKQIKKLYKDYKWATYYNADIDVLRNSLIYRLINSNKPLQDLKQSLKNNFE